MISERLLTFLGRTEFWITASAVVAFLILTWIFRGAPPGQSAEGDDDQEAPRAGYRDRIISAVVFGLLLIMGGAYAAIARGIPWSLPLFALGFGLVLATVRANQRYKYASPSLRRTVDMSSSLINLALIAGILIVLNVAAFRYGGRPLDLTREQAYSLSSLTLNQLTTLDRPVTFTLIFGRSPLAIRQRDRVDQLLESYKNINPRQVDVKTLDPYYDLTRMDELVKRVPDLALLHGGGVLVEYGVGTDSSHMVIRNQDMFAPIRPDSPASSSDRFETVFNGEDTITSALIRLRESKKSKVAFTTGHGEPRTDDTSSRGTGMGNWRSRLNSVGCEVLDINLLETDLPDDLSLLIIVGPKSPFKPEELKRLEAYTGRGGPVLVVTANLEPNGLGDFLKSFNLEFGPGLVLDPKYRYNSKPDMVLAPAQTTGMKHPIVGALESNRLILMPASSPVHMLGMPYSGRPAKPPVNRDLIPMAILRSSPFSWAESDLSNPKATLDRNTDEPGPIVLGVAVADRPTSEPKKTSQPADEAETLGRPRLALFSSSMMAGNILQEIEPTNLDLLMNAATWLRGKPAAFLGITPKTHVALALKVDPVLRSRLILVPTVTAALLIIAAGTLVYLTRRE